MIQIPVDTFGTIFRMQFVRQNKRPFDASAATTLTIYFTKPDGTTILTKTATFTNDGTDGQIEYVAISGDLDTVGTWNIQGRIEATSYDLRTLLKEFELVSN